METLILILFLAAAVLIAARHLKGAIQKPPCSGENSGGTSACSSCPEARNCKPRSG